MTNFLIATGVDAEAEPQLLCLAVQDMETKQPLSTMLLHEITEEVDGANPETREDSTEFIFDDRQTYDALREQIFALLEASGHRLTFHLGDVILKGEASVFEQLAS